MGLTPPPQLEAALPVPPSGLPAGLTAPQIRLPSWLHLGARVRPEAAPSEALPAGGSPPQGPALTTPFPRSQLLFFAAQTTTTSQARPPSLLARRGASPPILGPRSNPGTKQGSADARAANGHTRHRFLPLHSVLF